MQRRRPIIMFRDLVRSKKTHNKINGVATLSCGSLTMCDRLLVMILKY